MFISIDIIPTDWHVSPRSRGLRAAGLRHRPEGRPAAAAKTLGEGLMRSALMGSLQISCFFDTDFWGYSH